MLFSLIAIGSIWFWLLMLVAIVVGLALLENEVVGGLATFTVGFAVIAGLLMPIKPLLLWIWANPLLVLAGIGVYLVLGIIYSFFKYDRFHGHTERLYEETKTKWLKATGATEISAENKTAWSLFLRDSNNYGGKYHKRIYDYAFDNMTYLDYKALIVAWIVWWPLSGAWLLINDPLRKIAEWFVFRFRAVYVWIANRHRKSVVNDIETDENVLREAKYPTQTRR